MFFDGKRVQYYNLRPEVLSRKACCISKFSCYSYVQTLRKTTNLATIFSEGLKQKQQPLAFWWSIIKSNWLPWPLSDPFFQHFSNTGSIFQTRQEFRALAQIFCLLHVLHKNQRKPEKMCLGETFPVGSSRTLDPCHQWIYDLKKIDREYCTPFSGHKVGGTHGISKLLIIWTDVPVQHATIPTLGILTHPWLTETENGNGI